MGLLAMLNTRMAVTIYLKSYCCGDRVMHEQNIENQLTIEFETIASWRFC